MKKQVYNPYLPCWEYIPDGEPHIFNDRLYIFGSHDKFGGKWYCENDYATWSTPLDDLSDWRFEGVIYRKDQDLRPGNLYAPDVTQGPDGCYYLFYSKADSSVISVAVCDTPAGRYEYYGDVVYPDGHVLGERDSDWYQFDPAVLVDGDRVWLYSGSGQYDCQRRYHQKMVGCMAIELEQDMKTIRTAPKIIIPGSSNLLKPAFFEGASIRKIDDLYYLVFSARDSSGLNYSTSHFPDRDFVYRGRIHSTSDFGINGHHILNSAYPMGNNHGGLVCINEQWYIFDHRMTNHSPYSRQSVAEPITIEAGGFIRQVEATSCGLNGGPLRGEGTYPAYIACNLMGRKNFGFRIPLREPYMTQDEQDGDENAIQYLEGMRNGYTAGYKYFNFQSESGTIELRARCTGSGTLHIATDEDCRNVIGMVKTKPCPEWEKLTGQYHIPTGTHPLFFQYLGGGSLSILEFTLKN